MARSHLARYAAAAAWLCAVLPAAVGPAPARAVQASAATAPLSVTVTSVTPSYLRQGHAVTISGLVRNRSGTAASGLSVRLASSTIALTSRLDLANFAAGRFTPPESPVNGANPARPRLGAGQSWRWKIRLGAGSLAWKCFGVYPLTVRVGDTALQAATDQVPLPYWPTKPGSCPGQPRPRPFSISWIWPLVDTPHQDVCAGLTDNALAASIAPGGRLGSLLAVGDQYAARAALTWAVDPALLDSVHTMKQPYRAGTEPHCRGRGWHPASPDAARWLDELKRATSGRPVFVTPYADVDVAALVRHANGADLRRSLKRGDQVAHLALGRPAVPVALPAKGNRLSAIAWPPGGSASSDLLKFFATRHLTTVIMAAPASSPVPFTPGAVTSALTEIGTRLHFLLADRRLTALLGSPLASSGVPGARAHASQLFLAETAMIAAEAPGKQRPIVVAPPRRWDPTKSLAGELLGETVHAPWLKPSTAGKLVAMKPEHLYKKLTSSGKVGKHTRQLLNSVSRLDRKIALLQSIRVQPDPRLYRAVAGIESSAWRGRSASLATAMLRRTWRYVDSQLHGVSISAGGSGHAEHVTFGGSTAPVNVLIHNGLNYKVRVGLVVQATNAKVTGVPKSITIPAHNYSTTVRLSVHVKASHAKIRLTLVAPPRSNLEGHALPVRPQVILVHPTDFGVIALVIVAIALAVFVIASAFRAIRHGRPEPQQGAALPDDPDAPDPPAHGTALTSPDGASEQAWQQAPGAPSQAGAPGSAGAPGPAGAPSLVEETIPDWDRGAIQRSGLADLGNRPEHAATVDGERSRGGASDVRAHASTDRSELTPAERPAAGHEPAAPRGRADQERR